MIQYQGVMLQVVSAWTMPWNAGPICMWDIDLVIIVLAYGLAPNGARPSAGTLMPTKYDLII